MRHIVMTSTAKMPSNCWGVYKKVAVVQLTVDYAINNRRPKMISNRARGVSRIIKVWNRLYFGTTPRSAYGRALIQAEELCARYNTTTETAPSVFGAEGITSAAN